MKTVITGLMALVWSLGLHAQVADTAAVAPEVMPIESPELHGAREATEEEKAMARELARDQRNQQQTRFLRYDANGFTQLDSLTVKIHEPAETPVEDYYMPEYPLYALSHGFAPWELHKGLNVNLGASVSAGFGSGAVGGAAFTQDVNLMYVTQLSPKASLAVGGYLTKYYPEDYFLWIRMLMNGAKFYNIQESLLYFRYSPETIKKRGGWKYAIGEVHIQKMIYKLGFISFPLFIKNSLVRFVTRIMPLSLRMWIYSRLLREQIST